VSGCADCVIELLKHGVSPSSKYCKEDAVPAIVAAASRNHIQVEINKEKANCFFQQTAKKQGYSRAAGFRSMDRRSRRARTYRFAHGLFCGQSVSSGVSGGARS
jgi:hypothetical protein